MLALEIIVAAAVLVGVAFFASRDYAGLEDEPTDRADLGLPDGRPVNSQDLADLRIRTVSAFWGGIRGYRYGDVDAVLARVEETLRGYELAAEATTKEHSESAQAAAQTKTAERRVARGRAAHGRPAPPAADE